MTEPLTTQMGRPLIPLLQLGGTMNQSIGSDRLAGRYVSEWPNFTADVQSILTTLNLDGNISLSDPAPGEGDNYIVANELGLTARFVGNVAVPLGKAYNLTMQGALKFGDVHARRSSSVLYPDVTIIHTQNGICEIRAVGELKTYWTFLLEDYPISTTPPAARIELEKPMGQLVSYMRAHNLKYGWLSTYKATVFVRRMQPFRFEISNPILYDATGPTVRECFLAFGHLVQDDYKFDEVADFDPLMLCMDIGALASTRPSMYRPPLDSSTSRRPGSSNGNAPSSAHNGAHASHSNGQLSELGIDALTISSETVFIRNDANNVFMIDCGRVLSGRIPWKAVVSIKYKGEEAVAKFFPLERYKSFSKERAVYEDLQALLGPDGESPNFAMYLGSGEVVCSSFLPQGYVMVLEKIPGVPFSDSLWEDHTVRLLVEQELRKAVDALRSIGYIHGDNSKANVIVDTQSGRVALIDFEDVVLNTVEYDCGVDDGPEISTIMAPPNRMGPVV